MSDGTSILVSARRAVRAGLCLFALACGVLLSSAARAGEARSDGVWDPLEALNRAVYDFNQSLAGSIGEPASGFVDSYVPAGIRQGAYGVVNNLEEPVAAVANLLAGDIEGAKTASLRFLINTFVGWMGAEDVAAEYYGYERDLADLRKPLCRYGIPPGPVIVLPVFGEMHMRDLVGRYGTLIALYELLGLAYIPYRVTTGMFRALEDEQPREADGWPFEPPARDDYFQARARLLAEADSHC